MKKLTDICDIQYGYAFDSKCFTEEPLYPPLVRIRDVKRGYSETYYSGDYSEEYLITSGDLLILEWMENSTLLVGKVIGHY